jgi:hypothetical protein
MSQVTLEDLTDRLLDGTPEEILDQVFSEVDLENLQSIKMELGLCINWDTLIDGMYQMLMGGMDTLVFLETESDSPQVVKRNPYEALFDRDKARINGSDDKSQTARKYVLLMILKKLLGAVKTRVNKEFDKIETIDDFTEGELQELVRYGDPDEPDEEEMDLVTALQDEADQGEIIAAVDHRNDCPHRRQTVKQIPSTKTESRMDELHTFCKDCKQSLEIQKLKTRTTSRKAKDWGKPMPCQHRNGHWKDGEEGKTALCSDCKEVVPNPEKFEWSKAGLEPVGDDPSQDEIQSFHMNPKTCEHSQANNFREEDGVQKANCDSCGIEVDAAEYTEDVEAAEEVEETPKEMVA